MYFRRTDLFSSTAFIPSPPSRHSLAHTYASTHNSHTHICQFFRSLYDKTFHIHLWCGVNAAISCNTDDTRCVYIYIYIRFLIKSLECGRTVSHFSFVVGKMYKSAEEKERQVAWGKGKWRKCANTSVVILDSLLMPPSFLCVIQHWFGGLISCLFISHFDVRNDFNYISPTHIYTFTRPRALRREKIYTFFV